MDNKQMIFRCIAAVFLSLAIICNGEASSCSYQYTRQPVASMGNCSLEGYAETLKLICQVSGPSGDVFSIQWYYNMLPPTEFDDGLLATDLKFVTMKEQKFLENTNLASELLISVLDDDNAGYAMIDGYYWCTVNSTSDVVTANPSQIVRISSECFTAHNPSDSRPKCSTPVRLDGTPITSRCADGEFNSTGNDHIVDAWDSNLCKNEDYDAKTEPEVPTLTADGNLTVKNSNPTEAINDGKNTMSEMSTFSPDLSISEAGLSMHIVWISVGIAFGLLIAIIAIMLIAIICLTHKKNKIRVSSSVKNPYKIEYGNSGDSLKRETPVGSMTREDGQKSVVNGAAEVQYETLTNVIHAHNPTFGGEGSPESSTSLTKSAQIPSSLPGEYEDITTIVTTRGMTNQYETIGNEELPEYSRLQHVHGGSQQRKFNGQSTRTLPPPVPPSNNRGKISATLSWGGQKTEPQLMDEPKCAPIGVELSTPPSHLLGDGAPAQAMGYGHNNHELLQSTEGMELQGSDCDGYHQLPNVFTKEAKNINKPRLKQHVGSGGRQNIHSPTSGHHSAHRHNSPDATSDAYTLIDPSKVKEHNAYSVSILSTYDRYVSEQGHVYQVLERSDKYRDKTTSVSSSSGDAPKFRIVEGGDTKSSQTIPPYGQVTRSPKQTQRKVREMEAKDQSELNCSQDSNKGDTDDDSGCKIPPYSQVDKSKKIKNRLLKLEPQHSDASDGATGDSGRIIPLYSQVDKSKKIKNRLYQQEQQLSNDSEGATDDSGRIIPPYSQVDNSKNFKNRGAEAEEQEDSDETHDFHVSGQSVAQDSQNTHLYHILEQDDQTSTHHYHVLEHDTNGLVEQSCGMNSGPIYHLIDHEP